VTCPPPRSLDLEEESNKVKMIVHSIMRELKDEDVDKDNTMTEDELSLDNQTIQNSIDTNNQTGMLNKASSEVSQSSWPTFFTASVQTEQPTQQIFIPASADVIDVTEERADRSANVSTDTVDLKERLESDSAESNIELSLIEEAVDGTLGEREKSEKKKNKFKLRLFEQSSVREESEHIIEYHELRDLSPVGVELANGEVKKAEDPIRLSVVTDKMSQPSSVSPVSKLLVYTDLDPLITKAAPAEKVAPIKTVEDFSFQSPRRNRSGTLRKEDEGLEKSLKDDDKTPKMGRVRTFDKPFSKRFVFDTVNTVYSADSNFESSTDQDAFDQEFGIRGKQEHYANNKEDKKKLKKLSEDVKNDEPSNVDSCESNIELSLVEDEDAMDAPVEEEKICKRPKFNRWGKRIKKTMKDKKRTNQEPKGFASASDNKNVINSNRNSHSIKMTEVPYVASPTASKRGTKKKLLRIETKSTDSEPKTKSKRKKSKKQPYPAISETFSSELYESIDSDDSLDYITDFFCCGDDTL